MAGLRDHAGRGALYCCIPHRADADQSPVDVQERQGRALAATLRINVRPALVFADRRRSVWQSQAGRPGWTALLAAIRAGRVDTVLLFRPSMLIRHRATDAAELLALAEENLVALQGFGDELNLNAPEVRKNALEQARQLSHTAAALSDSVRAAHRAAADSGQPHGGGRRAYGYETSMRALIPAEAAVIREIYSRYLGGESLRAIAWDLNARTVPTSAGSTWTTTGIDRVLVAPRYAGLRVFQGGVDQDDGGLRPGTWEPCVSVEDWRNVQVERTARAAAVGKQRQRARYLLTGLVICGQCHVHMVGSIVGEYRMYACASLNSPLPKSCNLHIAAASLERFISEAAVELLTDWDGSLDVDGPVIVRRGPAESAEPVAGRRTGFRRDHGQVDLRDAGALDGVTTGPNAASQWRRLPEARRIAVLRAVFASVVIGPKTTARSVFDTSRITVVRNAPKPEV